MNGQTGRRRVLRRLFVFLSSFFCAIFLTVCPGNAAQVLRVSIPGVVLMEGEACALSDIAVLEGPREQTERIGALLLSARDGVITREQVIAALKVSGLEGVRVELKMPASVKVEIAAREGEAGDDATGESSAPASESAPPGRSREALAERIKSMAAWEGEVEVQYQGSIPEGRLTSPASIVPGTSAATLRFRDESGKERPLPVRLAWNQPALMLTRPVKRGEVLKESDFVVRQIRVNRAGMYASRLSETVGRSLRKNLSQGEAVPLSLLVNVPVIERGKSVTILVRSAGLTVKTKGEALEDGSLGDSIKVRNVASKAVLTAVVVADDTVEVMTMP
ncbi:MAG: flagellar basal body P-ring formation chaperone FlgA [Synergistaceae bacterium]|jgi:flagella basal body P-ring formation protein FlgA|nr:flagellar basal body P-ring formation chaperone FlgA [Synergistaceae bacterium]